MKTAILYDTQNQLRGSFPSKRCNGLLSKHTLDSIRKQAGTEGIALQRAYANWRDPRLKGLAEELDRLGVQQVQTFGGGFDPRKNAADIQLAIDAVELIRTHPSLQTFVIVSGDGGFAALAVKLREHGKRVIGCGYRRASSPTFQGVCDEFVFIDEPQQQIAA